jgi:hypothetical protein
VRYVDAVREGETIESTFVAVHESGPSQETLPIESADLIAVPEAGPRAVALRIITAFGDYLVLNDFDQPAEVDGVRFQGVFGMAQRQEPALASWMTVGASTFSSGDTHIDDPHPVLSAGIKEHDTTHIVPNSDRPLPHIDSNTEAYVRAKINGAWTGFPIASRDETSITTKDYPLPTIEQIELLAVRYHGE